jgi:hypothetical protein
LVVWKTRYQYLYTLFLAALVISVAQTFLFVPTQHTSGVLFIANIVLEILYFYIVMATTALVLHLLRTNEERPIKELTQYGPLFLKYLVVNILYGLMVLGGIILLVIPGIYLLIRYAWVTLYTIEHPDKSIKELFHETSEMTEGHRLEIFWLLIVMIIPIMLVSGIVSEVVAGQTPQYQNFVTQVVNYAFILPWALLISCNAYLKLCGTPTARASEALPSSPKAQALAMPEASSKPSGEKPAPELIP